MPTMSVSRRIAAALTAVIVAGALVILGGASHSTPPSGRLVVGHSHAGVSAAAAKVAPTSGKHHISPHPDLPSTAPSVDTMAATGSADVTPSAYASRVARDLAAPTGRGPPAL